MPAGRHEGTLIAWPDEAIRMIVDRCELEQRSVRPQFKGNNEAEWCSFVMSRHADWITVTGLSKFDEYRLEYQVTRRRDTGMPRFDAVGWRDGRATIIEAKVHCSSKELMSGAGQLIHYRTVAKRLGWDVEALVLVSPSWPMLFLETLDDSQLPIIAARLSPDGFAAWRPGYGATAKRDH